MSDIQAENWRKGRATSFRVNCPACGTSLALDGSRQNAVRWVEEQGKPGCECPACGARFKINYDSLYE